MGRTLRLRGARPLSGGLPRRPRKGAFKDAIVSTSSALPSLPTFPIRRVAFHSDPKADTRLVASRRTEPRDTRPILDALDLSPEELFLLDACVFWILQPVLPTPAKTPPSKLSSRGRLLLQTSILVFPNAEGFFIKNPFDAYTLNDITAKKDADGSIEVQFGGCGGKVANCLPITPGWNYIVRLYRPRTEILSGSWKFPEAQPL